VSTCPLGDTVVINDECVKCVDNCKLVIIVRITVQNVRKGDYCIWVAVLIAALKGILKVKESV